MQVINLLVIDSLISLRSCQLTASWIQPYSDSLLQSLHRLENLAGFVQLGLVPVDSIKRTDGAIAGWENEGISVPRLVRFRRGPCLRASTGFIIVH